MSNMETVTSAASLAAALRRTQNDVPFSRYWRFGMLSVCFLVLVWNWIPLSSSHLGTAYEKNTLGHELALSGRYPRDSVFGLPSKRAQTFHMASRVG